jgi:membrane-associated protease RseP (regulator of RpoE activity)
VLVAADDAQSRRGWAYAVPIQHVQRLLRAEAARDSAKNKDKGVIVLKRRRPVVGMVLEGEENAILVQRITPGGPAEKAGLKVGDRVVAAGGVNIRSVYQAVLPTLYKQPGDTMDFLVERGGRTHDCRVTLGGGVEVASAPYEQLGNLIQPKLEIGRDPQGGYYANRPGNTTAEVFSPPGSSGVSPSGAQRSRIRPEYSSSTRSLASACRPPASVRRIFESLPARPLVTTCPGPTHTPLQMVTAGVAGWLATPFSSAAALGTGSASVQIRTVTVAADSSLDCSSQPVLAAEDASRGCCASAIVPCRVAARRKATKAGKD